MLVFQILLSLMIVHIHSVHSAKILGVFPIPSISHQIVFQAIWKELSLRGHEVTVITPNPLNNRSLTNLTEIDVSSTYTIIRNANLQQSLKKDLLVKEIIDNAYTMLGNVLEEEFSHPEVQALIKDKTKYYDLVMAEYLTPAAFAFSVIFKCPLIGISSMSSPLNGHDAVGNPSHPTLQPDLFLPYTGESGIFDRIRSTLYAIWYRYYYHSNILPQQDAIVKKHLGKKLPYLGDIEKNVSLLFFTENLLIYAVRPNVPLAIQLTNIHIKKAKPLPKDLQKELDAATEGVVYFSLGSNVKSSSLSVEIREKIIGALSEIPYKVLWKWENEYLPGQPKNVVIRKWLPQQDVLGHPNIKVFVTQGGLQSIEESISRGVPLVGMPFYGDQPLNVKKMVGLGIAEMVDILTLTKEDLKAAIIEVVENPKYRNQVKELSLLAADVPMTSLEKAVWWTEYIIRHKGAPHLRSPAVEMPWYQYFLLDVIGFVLAVVIAANVVLYKVIKLSINYGKHCFNTPKLKMSESF